MDELELIEPDWFENWFKLVFGAEIVTPPLLIRAGFKKDQIYKALADGSLDGFKPDGRWYIPGPALKKWLIQSYTLNF